MSLRNMDGYFLNLNPLDYSNLKDLELSKILDYLGETQIQNLNIASMSISKLKIQSYKSISAISIQNISLVDGFEVVTPEVDILQIIDSNIAKDNFRIRNINSLKLVNTSQKIFKFSSPTLKSVLFIDNITDHFEISSPVLKKVNIILPNVKTFIMDGPVTDYSYDFPNIEVLCLFSSSLKELDLTDFENLRDLTIESDK